MVYWFSDFLDSMGTEPYYAKWFGLVFNVLVIALAAIILRIISRFLLVKITERIAVSTEIKFDDYLIHNHFFRNVARLVPLYFIYKIYRAVLVDFQDLIPLFVKAFSIFCIITVVLIIRSFLLSLKDYLKNISKYSDKPIDSYIQVVSIVIWIFAIITIILNLFDTTLQHIVATFGAVSAIVILIFKDTILGFVASIQVTANDLVRIGDWITLDKYGADGYVTEINLATVKVRNFDNTTTTVPTYSLISGSFINWRGMFDSGGRRIKRHIYIKESTIKFVCDAELEKFKKIELISNYIDHRKRDIDKFNNQNEIDKSLLINGRNLTNLGLFRKYLHNYLLKQQVLSNDLILTVRHLQATDKGIPVEIYCFSKEKNFVNFEHIQSDIFDHIIASVSYFDLEIFELPSSSDFKHKSKQPHLNGQEQMD